MHERALSCFQDTHAEADVLSAEPVDIAFDRWDLNNHPSGAFATNHST